MGEAYKYNINPFQDYLYYGMQQGVDIADEKNVEDVNMGFLHILEYILYNKKDAVYLDYKITRKDQYYKVVALNFISALWLSGIIPSDTTTVINDNKLIINNMLYKYDKRNKKLKYSIIKK